VKTTAVEHSSTVITSIAILLVKSLFVSTCHVAMKIIIFKRVRQKPKDDGEKREIKGRKFLQSLTYQDLRITFQLLTAYRGGIDPMLKLS
jgi:hypothetical protein